MKRWLAVMVAVGMMIGALAAAPVKAQDAPEIPATPNIVDPDGDGNMLNDQGFGAEAGFQGDNSGGASFAQGDFNEVWFTHTSTDISVHMTTHWLPPHPSFGILFRVQSNDGCLRFAGTVPSLTYTGDQKAVLDDTCDTAFAPVEGTITITEVPEERGLTTLTFPRSAHPALADGLVLTAPFATSRIAWGQLPSPSPYSGLVAPQIDNTKPGADYTITAAVVEEPPPGNDADKPGKGKQQRCKKGKPKKKCKKA